MSQVNSETIEKTKQQIRGLVGEIQQLSKSDLTEEEYYSAFLQRVIQALAAIGGAIWTLGEGKKPKLAYQVNISPTLMDPESEDASKHSKLLEYIVNTNQGQLIPPLSSAGDERLGGNPTRQLMVVAPLGHDGTVEGLIEIFQRPDTQPATQKGYLRFMQQMCDIASEWFKNRKLGQLTDKHSLWADADEFSRAVHETLDLRETCYTIVNEGRRLLGVDRVSVAIKRAGRCEVEAVSGQDTVDNRSNVMTMLGKLATRVAASGEPLWYMGSTEDMPPQIEEALEEYVDHSYTKSLCVLPLRKPRTLEAAPTNVTGGDGNQPLGEIIGVLIVEQIESEIPREVLDPKLDLVFEHSARALSNSIEHNTLFLMPVWRAIGHSQVMVQARNLPRTLTIGGSILAVVLALFIVPWNFDMAANGVVQPKDRSDYFVPERAVVVTVNVDNNSQVNVGDVLAILRSDELQIESKRVEGELGSKREQLNAIRQRLTDTSRSTPQERNRDTAEASSVRVEIESLETQQRLLREREEKLTIRSKTKGTVITWDAKRQLENRPVETGQVLLTVAAENTPWELELYMPERRVNHLVRQQEMLKGEGKSPDLDVSYVLMTQPGTQLVGKVKEVHWTAEPHEQQGHMVRVRVETIDPENKLKKVARPGASVKAHVTCGRTVLGWAKLHEAWEWLQANVFFM